MKLADWQTCRERKETWSEGGRGGEGCCEGREREMRDVVEGEEGKGMEEQRRQREGGWGGRRRPTLPNLLLPHLVQSLHVVWLCPVLGNGGIPTVTREIVDEALQELLESFLGLLNVHVRPPDNEVGLRGCLAGHSRGRRLTSLQCTSIRCTHLTIHT